MPSYFYNLKFELYPYPSVDDQSIPSNTSPSKQKRTKDEEEERRRKIWFPEEGTDIFDSAKWPRHKRVKVKNEGAERRGFGKSGGPGETQAAGVGVATGTGGGGVIDCGLARASHTPNEDEEEGITVQILNERNIEFPPPNTVNIQRDQRTAVKDWRFGRVRIESLDMKEIADFNSNTDTDTDMASAQRPRGESSSGGTASNGINAGLAPEAAGVGRVTKARYEVVQEKNTEVGWGIVHLYRDGEETPGLGNTEVVYTAGSEAPGHQRQPSAGLGVKDEEEHGEDCTTLCIPAVPSYLTPSDFLGFVGEKTREEVSHFRMVMTGRMNRYLVLMKFRDGNAARRWRKEWDGKVFNSMEASFPLSDLEEELISSSARNMPRNLHQVDYFPNTDFFQTQYQLPRALP
jgi:BRCA1-associated protein